MKRFFAGLIIGAVLATAVSVFAEDLPVRLFVDGKEVVSDVPPQIINGRTLVPARPLAEALGAAVTWDAATRSVIVTKAPATTADGATAPTQVDSSALFMADIQVAGKVFPATLARNEAGSLCIALRSMAEFAAVTSPSDVPRETLAMDVDGTRLTRDDLWTPAGRTFVCAETITAKLKWQTNWDAASNTLTIVK